MGSRGDPEWDGFQIVDELTKQNTALVLEVDEQQRRLQAVQAELRMYKEKDVTTGKIIELSKRNRALSISFEKERGKVTRLEQELKNARKGAAGHAQKETSYFPKADATAVMWKQKCQQLEGKFAEAQALCTKLKQDNEKMARIIRNEVGDDYEAAKGLSKEKMLLEKRGRAQEILVLKDRVQQGERKIKKLKAALAQPGAPKPAEEGRSAQKHQDHKALNEMRKALEAASQELSDTKMKYSATHARKKAVETEMREMQKKVKLILEKAENDDKLIGLLKKEIQKMQGKHLPGGTDNSAHVSASAPPRLSRLATDGSARAPQLAHLYAQLSEKIRAQAQQIAVQGQIITALSDHGRDL